MRQIFPHAVQSKDCGGFVVNTVLRNDRYIEAAWKGRSQRMTTEQLAAGTCRAACLQKLFEKKGRNEINQRFAAAVQAMRAPTDCQPMRRA